MPLVIWTLYSGVLHALFVCFEAHLGTMGLAIDIAF